MVRLETWRCRPPWATWDLEGPRAGSSRATLPPPPVLPTPTPPALENPEGEADLPRALRRPEEPWPERSRSRGPH